MRSLIGFLLLTFMLPASRTQAQVTKPVSLKTRIEIHPSVFKRFSEFSKWSPAEWSLLKDVADSKLEDHSLFEASLVVGAHTKPEIAQFKRELAKSIHRCKAKLDDNLSTRVKLKAIFAHIAKEFLRGEYRADLFDVGKTMRTGEFNCLTATVLFQAFCEANSLEVRILWEPAHVQCWAPKVSDLDSDNFRAKGYLIETTASSPANAISPLTNLSGIKGRPLSATEFVGKIFYNRGVRALNNDEYPKALISTWACCVLDDADRPAQSNLRACINNWALFSAQERDVAMVQRLFDVGIKLDPQYEPFSRNRAILLEENDKKVLPASSLQKPF